jgi:hypothetical protein
MPLSFYTGLNKNNVVLLYYERGLSSSFESMTEWSRKEWSRKEWSGRNGLEQEWSK